MHYRSLLFLSLLSLSFSLAGISLAVFAFRAGGCVPCVPLRRRTRNPPLLPSENARCAFDGDDHRCPHKYNSRELRFPPTCVARYHVVNTNRKQKRRIERDRWCFNSDAVLLNIVLIYSWGKLFCALVKHLLLISRGFFKRESLV